MVKMRQFWPKSKALSLVGWRKLMNIENHLWLLEIEK